MRPALHVVEPDEAPAPKPPILPTHVTFDPAARGVFTRIDGIFGQMRRTFSGPSATVAAAADLDRLCAEAMAELQRLRRFAR